MIRIVRSYFIGRSDLPNHNRSHIINMVSMISDFIENNYDAVITTNRLLVLFEIRVYVDANKDRDYICLSCNSDDLSANVRFHRDFDPNDSPKVVSIDFMKPDSFELLKGIIDSHISVLC